MVFRGHQTRRDGPASAHELRERNRRSQREGHRRRRLALTGLPPELRPTVDDAPVAVRAEGDPPRRCRRCGCALNHFNPRSLCHPCRHAGGGLREED